MIFYFTGTGNSLFAARRLADEGEQIVSIVDALRSGTFHYVLKEGEKLDEEVSLPGNSTDPEKLSALTAKRAAVDQQLQELYERWELLSEQTEQS